MPLMKKRLSKQMKTSEATRMRNDSETGKVTVRATAYCKALTSASATISSSSSQTHASNDFTTLQPRPPSVVSTGFNPLRNALQIIQPIDPCKRRRPHDFDPTTIARDVLRSTRGLNSHLEILKTQFSAVDEFSDLSTFRWDLVDPSHGPGTRLILAPARTSASMRTFEQNLVRVTNGPGQTKDSSPLPVAVAARERPQQTALSTVTPNIISTMTDHPARPPVGPSTRHPAPGGPFQSYLNRVQNSPPRHRHGISSANYQQTSHSHPAYYPVQQSTQPVNFQQINHGHPIYNSPQLPYRGSSSIGPGTHGQSLPYSPPKPAQGGLAYKEYGPRIGQGLLQKSNGPVEGISAFQVVLKSPAIPRPPARIIPQFSGHVTPSAPDSDISSRTGTARRGRPPKSLASSNGTPTKRLFPSRKKRERRSKSAQESGTITSIPKKRGRPFKDIEAEFAAVGRPSSTELTTKKRGRPSKNEHEPVFLPSPKPVFHPFLCEWGDCPAELLNLETLRRHIFNVHINKRKVDKAEAICLWANCGLSHKSGKEVEKSPEAMRPRLQFDTQLELRDHVDESHLIPCSWHMGDGPKATSLRMFCKGNADSYTC
jgi:hypothetical protein